MCSLNAESMIRASIALDNWAKTPREQTATARARAWTFAKVADYLYLVGSILREDYGEAWLVAVKMFGEYLYLDSSKKQIINELAEANNTDSYKPGQSMHGIVLKFARKAINSLVGEALYSLGAHVRAGHMMVKQPPGPGTYEYNVTITVATALQATFTSTITLESTSCALGCGHV